jgi:Transposase IS116/IS110/IS902 family
MGRWSNYSRCANRWRRGASTTIWLRNIGWRFTACPPCSRAARRPRRLRRPSGANNRTPQWPLLFQKFGVDITAVAGVNTHDGSTFLTEVGPNLDRFASLENFASWLGLCPKKSQRPPPAQRQYPAAFQTAGDLNSIFFILHSADVSPRPVSKRWRRRCAWRRNR